MMKGSEIVNLVRLEFSYAFLNLWQRHNINGRRFAVRVVPWLATGPAADGVVAFVQQTCEQTAILAVRAYDERVSHRGLSPDDFDLRQWEDHFAAAVQKRTFSLNEIVAKVPRKNKKVIGFHGVCLCLGDDWDVRAGSNTAEFVWIYFRNC